MNSNADDAQCWYTVRNLHIKCQLLIRWFSSLLQSPSLLRHETHVLTDDTDNCKSVHSSSVKGKSKLVGLSAITEWIVPFVVLHSGCQQLQVKTHSLRSTGATQYMSFHVVLFIWLTCLLLTFQFQQRCEWRMRGWRMLSLTPASFWGDRNNLRSAILQLLNMKKSPVTM